MDRWDLPSPHVHEVVAAPGFIAGYKPLDAVIEAIADEAVPFAPGVEPGKPGSAAG